MSNVKSPATVNNQTESTKPVRRDGVDVLLGDPDNFTGQLDNTTFGVYQGKTFVLGERSDVLYDFVMWARANAMYFESVVQRLIRFAELRQSEKSAGGYSEDGRGQNHPGA